MKTEFVIDNVKINSKGQVTIPKDVRDALGITCGNRVTFVVENDSVRIVNPAIFAMQMLQSKFAGAAEKLNLKSDEDIIAMIKDIRSTDNKE